MATKKGTARRNRTAPKRTTSLHSGANDTALRAALWWASRGRYIIPHGSDKRPLVKDWTGGGASTDAEQIHAWSRLPSCTGFGFLCGARSGEVVVDIDKHRNGSRASVQLTPTLTVVTPHGGTHHHFAAESPVAPNPKLAEGVELLGDGRFCILPGSRVQLEDGSVGTYTLLTPGTRRLAPLPASLAAGTPQRPADGLSAAQGAITQGDRHKALMSFAGRLRYEGHDHEEILAALTVYNERYCDPPKDAKEIAHIADSAAKYAGGEEAMLEQELQRRRVRDEADAIVRAERAEREWDESVLPTGTVGEFFAQPDLEQPFTIDGWHLQGGNTLLVASYKSGKTVCAINVAYSLVTGEPFLGRYSVNDIGGRVVFFNYELTDDTARRWMRARGLAGHDRLAHPLNLRGKSLNLASPHVRAKLVAWLKRNEATFWIADTASMAWQGVVDNENNNSQIVEFTKRLDEIKHEAGVKDLLLTHHQGRAVFAEGTERSRGGTRLEDWMDSGWYLTKGDDGVRSLRSIGRGTDNDAITLSYTMQTRKLTAGAARSDVKLAPLLENVVRRVSDEPGILMGGEKGLRKTNAIGGQSRALTIKRAIDDGYIRVEKEGQRHRHFVTEAGKRLLEHRVSIPSEKP